MGKINKAVSMYKVAIAVVRCFGDVDCHAESRARNIRRIATEKHRDRRKERAPTLPLL
jgi:hypothetical protein